MTRKKQNRKYIFSDFLGSALAYTLFFAIRQMYFDVSNKSIFEIRPDKSFFLGITIIPFIWLLIFYISGYYRNTYRKSTINEFTQTFFSVIIGSLFFFFTVLLDDMIKSQSIHYISLLTFIGIEFTCIYIPRLLFTHHFKNKIRSGQLGFKTLLAGTSAEILATLDALPKDLGNIVIGYLSDDAGKKHVLNGVKNLGTIDQLEKCISETQTEEVILAYPNKQHEAISQILEVLFRNNVFIRASQKTAEQLIGQVKLFPSYGTSLVEILHDLMPPYEENLKRLIDISVSSIALCMLFPYFMYVALRIKLGSKGPVFYKQERIGLDRTPFKMIKFRSMYENAETKTPLLTEPEDSRITPFGRFMRKYRIDELPQFWNVLKGEMSLVGPRPEREFFIQQIVAKDPNYLFLLKVRPGITSLGMVKYGYADNVDKMLERLKYDMIYIKNMSILFDFKIIIYTFRTILTGKGV